MSIHPTTCTSAVMSSAIVQLWLCGVMLGGGLTLLSRRVCGLVRRGRRHKRRLGKARALLRYERQEEVSDHLLDERIDCWACWQERHPGMLFPFPRRHLCCEHVNPQQVHAAIAIIGEPPSVNQLSSIEKYRGVKERCV